MIFGKRLKELRETRELSQAELAKRLNVAKSTVSMWENNKREPEYEMLENICDLFNVDPNYLFGEINDNLYYMDPNIGSLAQDMQGLPNFKDFLSNYHKLNNDGQAIANNTVKGLTMVPQYTEKEKPLSIFERPDVAMAASGLTPNSELSEHNKDIILKHYNKNKQ